MEYCFNSNNIEDLLKKLASDDIVIMTGEDLINLLGAGTNHSKGRKPIEVDSTLFDETVCMWQEGKISARQAMERVNLKPNTFYRRIKERSKTEMKDIKSEIKESMKAEKKELKELKKQVKSEAEAIKEIAAENAQKSVSLHKMEKEIRHEKNAAEQEYKRSEQELRAMVEEERKAHKANTCE